MLDSTQTQIVSRNDLVPPKSPERAVQTVDWSSILGYSIDDDAGSPVKDDDGDISIASASDHKPAEVSFRLFAPTKSTSKDEDTTIQSYILPASPPPEQVALLAASLTADIPPISHFSEEDIKNAHATHRPTNYYLLTPPLEDRDHDTSERAANIRDAAVSGEQVVEDSRKRWAGCELSWRVMKLELVSGSDVANLKGGMASESTKALQAIPKDREGRKRHRPNKKRRIIIRKSRAAKEASEAKKTKNAVKKKNKKKKAETAAAVQAVVHKRTDEEDREKKTRMNRLKKVRRKMKLKEKAA